MENEEIKKRNSSKKRKYTLLENIHLNKKKIEKKIEEKQKIEQEEERIRQGQIENMKNIYDHVFKSLNINIEQIILSSKNEDEIVDKVKESLGMV
jgi:hypothetical protein